jgi:hypothetical protein
MIPARVPASDEASTIRYILITIPTTDSYTGKLLLAKLLPEKFFNIIGVFRDGGPGGLGAVRGSFFGTDEVVL